MTCTTNVNQKNESELNTLAFFEVVGHTNQVTGPLHPLRLPAVRHVRHDELGLLLRTTGMRLMFHCKKDDL